MIAAPLTVVATYKHSTNGLKKVVQDVCTHRSQRTVAHHPHGNAATVVPGSPHSLLRAWWPTSKVA
jgi:succinate dehydrogenase hydrophobic anchor subunit